MGGGGWGREAKKMWPRHCSCLDFGIGGIGWLWGRREKEKAL